MASLEDKILKDDRRENYVSDSDSGEEFLDAVSTTNPVLDGPQTGPKGVLQDYKRFEESTREEGMKQTVEQTQQFKEMAITCKSTLDEEKEKSQKKVSSDFPEDEEFLKAYREKRLQEIKDHSKAPLNARKYYGNLLEIRGDKYADVIDNAPKGVTLVIHIYDEFLAECRLLNKALTQLAKRYPSVKFCRVQAYQVQVSDRFRKDGLPAVLVYKDGNIMGNFLKVTDDLGREFVMEDVETFLQEKDCLPSVHNEPSAVICKLTGDQETSDDD